MSIINEWFFFLSPDVSQQEIEFAGLAVFDKCSSSQLLIIVNEQDDASRYETVSFFY